MRTLFIAIVIGCLAVVGVTSLSQAAETPGATNADQVPTASPCIDVQKLALNANEQRVFLDTVQPVFAGQMCAIGHPRVAVGDVTSSYFAQEILVYIDDQPVARFADPILNRLIARAAQWTAEEMRGRLAAEHAHDVAIKSANDAPVAIGYLRVNSTPWASVWIDGTDIGEVTPVIKHRLPAGPHTVTLKNVRFRCEGTYEVVIVPDQTFPLVKRLDCAE